jgi:LPXTG-motif cell wall-anchored protein
MKRSAFSLLILIGLMGAFMAPLAKADPVYKRTEVTFSEPVEIPGMVLPAGTYVMKLLDPYMDRDIVRFYNAREDHMYKMVFAVRDYRLVPVDHTVITFEERANNAPQAIKEWFPAGENWGEEFVYPKPPIAAQVPPQQLQPRPTALAPVPAPIPESKPAAPLAPVAQVQPQQPPVEIAQAQPSPAPSKPAAAEPVKELPKTASNLPIVGLFGGMLLLAGAILRRKTA